MFMFKASVTVLLSVLLAGCNPRDQERSAILTEMARCEREMKATSLRGASVEYQLVAIRWGELNVELARLSD